MLELIFGAMERRREIVIAIHREDFHPGILPNRIGEVRARVRDLLLSLRRLVREVPI